MKEIHLFKIDDYILVRPKIHRYAGITEKKIKIENIKEICEKFYEKCNIVIPGKDFDEFTEEIKSIGKTLFKVMFKEFEPAFKRLREGSKLLFEVEEGLLQIPYEIIYDDEFWGLKFQIARIIRIKRERKFEKIYPPLKMLIIKNPTEDRDIEKDAKLETIEIINRLSRLKKKKRIKSLDLRGGFTASKQEIKANLFKYNIIHYIGHAEKDGWKLYKGEKLKAEDVKDLPLEKVFLIFANACETSFDIAKGFVEAGVRHYIGSFFKIPSHDSANFAVKFYRKMLEGETIGHILLELRNEFYRKRSIVWCGYAHFGNPSDKIIKEKIELPEEEYSASTIFSDAIEYMEEGNYKEAKYCIEKAIEDDEKNPVYWYYLGKVLEEMGENKKAINAFRKARKIDPACKDAIIREAELMLKETKDYQSVIKLCNAVLEKEKNMEALHLKASAFIGLKKYWSAIEIADEILKNDEKDVRALFIKGRALFEIGEFEKALEILDKVTEMKPEHSTAWFYKGRVFFELRNYEESEKSFKEALKYEGDKWEIYAELGWTYRYMEKYKEMKEAFCRVVELNPMLPDGWLGLAEACCLLGEYEEALQTAEKFIKLNPEKDAEIAWRWKGEALFGMGRYEEAKMAFEKALEIDPHYDKAKEGLTKVKNILKIL